MPVHEKIVMKVKEHTTMAKNELAIGKAKSDAAKESHADKLMTDTAYQKALLQQERERAR